MKVNLVVDVEKCPYWNYENHTRTHDCSSCHCLSEGNTIDNAQLGVMIQGDRYCAIDCDIYGELVETIEENK